MYVRQKFVTNSSSTSIVAFGVSIWGSQVNEEVYELVEEQWENGISSRTDPGGMMHIYISKPTISLDENGFPTISDAEKFQERYQRLKKFLEDNNLPTDIGYIEHSWWDG